MKERIPLVLFSGGADSTAVLEMRLMDSNCDILVSSHYFHPNKVIAEAAAREKIIAHLNATSEFRIKKIYDVRKTLVAPSTGNMNYQQMLAWLFAAIYTVDPERHSMVDMGYVGGDDALQRLDKLSQTWDMMVETSMVGRWDHEKRRHMPLDLPLVFPFRWMSKKDVYHRLGKQLFDMTWSCELPRDGEGDGALPIACGHCVPCKTRAATVAEIGYPFDGSADMPATEITELQVAVAPITDPSSARRERSAKLKPKKAVKKTTRK